MSESLFTPRNEWLKATINPEDPNSVKRAQMEAALHHAISLAFESAFRFGIDMPVGAVALKGATIVGRGFANDKRFGRPDLHAERVALSDIEAESIAISLEPCVKCQDFLAAEGVENVAFGVSRIEAAAMGLVRPAEEDIFQRAQRIGLPYEVVKIDNQKLHTAGLTVLRHVRRDIDIGGVVVDVPSLSDALAALNDSELTIGYDL